MNDFDRIIAEFETAMDEFEQAFTEYEAEIQQYEAILEGSASKHGRGPGSPGGQTPQVGAD